MEHSPSDDMARFRSLVESGLFGAVKKSRVRSEAPVPKPRTFDSKMMAIVEHQVLDTAVPGVVSADSGRVDTPTRRHSVDSNIGRRRTPTFVRTYREVQWKRVNTAFKNSRRFSEGSCVMPDNDASAPAKAEEISPPDAESHEYVNGKHIIRKRVSIFISKAPVPSNGKGRRYSTGDLVPVTGSSQSWLPHGKCLIIKDLPRKSSMDSAKPEPNGQDETLNPDDCESFTGSPASDSQLTEGFTFEEDDEDVEDDDDDCYEDDSEESSTENVRLQRSRPSSASSSRSPSPVVHGRSLLTSQQVASTVKSPNLRRRAMANAVLKTSNVLLTESRDDGSKHLNGVDHMTPKKHVMLETQITSSGDSLSVVPELDHSKLNTFRVSHSTSCPALSGNSGSFTTMDPSRRSSASCVASTRTSSNSQYGNRSKKCSVRGGVLPLYLQLSAPVSVQTIDVPTGHNCDSLRVQKLRYEVGSESMTVFKWSADIGQERTIHSHSVSNGVNNVRLVNGLVEQFKGNTPDSHRSLAVSDVTGGHAAADSGEKMCSKVMEKNEKHKSSERRQIERKGRFLVEPVDYLVKSVCTTSSEAAIDGNLNTIKEFREDKCYLGNDSWSSVLKRSLSASFRDLLDLSPRSDTGGSLDDLSPVDDLLGGQADAPELHARVDSPHPMLDSNGVLENFRCLLVSLPHTDDEGGSEKLHLANTWLFDNDSRGVR